MSYNLKVKLHEYFENFAIIYIHVKKISKDSLSCYVVFWIELFQQITLLYIYKQSHPFLVWTRTLSYFCSFAVGFLNANILHFVDCKSFSLLSICEGVKSAKTTILHSYVIGSLSLILITYIGIVIEINHIIPSI